MTCDHGDHIVCNECTKPAGDVAQVHLDQAQLHADDYNDKNYPDEREVLRLKEETMNEPQLSAEMANTLIDPTKHGRKDLTGMRFGRLIAVKIVGRAGSHMRWLCECDCGRSKIISSPQLIRGVTRSCGCLQTDTFTTHNLSKHRLYLTWYDMMRRCEKVDHKNYCDYGGRGIKVCKRWHDISNFVKDMDDSYKPGLSIERIDNNDGYKKSNCKWATKREQQRNRRNSMFYTINGVTKQLCEWVDESKMNKNTVKNRLHRGFSITQALGMEQL